MDYVKRNEALGDWNFEVSDMTFGQEILKKYPQIAEYSIKVSYNRIFGSAGAE